MIRILGYQHLGDQRLSRNAAFDDTRRCGSLHDRALARAAAVARSARDQDAEGGRHDIETLGDILADLVERTAAAGAGLILDIHDLLDPFEMRRQRTAVGLAHPIAVRPSGLRFGGDLGLGERRLDILETQLQLIGIELFGTAAEPVAPKRLEDRPQTFDFRTGTLELAGLFEDERAERVNIIRQVRFHEHGSSESAEERPVNQQSAVPVAGARHGRGASPVPPEEPRAARP